VSQVQREDRQYRKLSLAKPDGKGQIPGVRMVHMLVAQIFRMEDLYRKPETLRPRLLHQILTDRAKWRRVLNRRKPLSVGDLGQLRPLISSGERFNEFWRASLSNQFGSDPFIYFIPLELNLSATRNFSGFRCDLHSVLDDEPKAEIENCQITGSIRIYPHGIGVVRLAFTVTFKDFVISGVIAKILSSVQDLYFIDANSVQTRCQALIFETVEQISSAIFGTLTNPAENVCWLPPTTALSVVAKNDGDESVPIEQLAYLMSRAPANDEREDVLIQRLETAVRLKEWRDRRTLAVAGQGVGMFYARNSRAGGTSESLQRLNSCFREAYELVSVARYSGVAFAEQIESISARRELDNTWLPNAENGRFKELVSLLEEMVAAKRATYNIKNHLHKTGAGILISFAKQVWTCSGGEVPLGTHLDYIQDWAKNSLGQIAEEDLEHLVQVIQNILTISAPFA
jgi:hypothetical protein